MRKVMAVLENKARCCNHRISALLARKPGVFLDAVKGKFAGAPVYEKPRLVWGKGDRIVPPFALANFAPVEAEDLAKLITVKRNEIREICTRVPRPRRRLSG